MIRAVDGGRTILIRTILIIEDEPILLSANSWVAGTGF